jgi:hypothetical protein
MLYSGQASYYKRVPSCCEGMLDAMSKGEGRNFSSYEYCAGISSIFGGLVDSILFWHTLFDNFGRLIYVFVGIYQNYSQYSLSLSSLCTSSLSTMHIRLDCYSSCRHNIKITGINELLGSWDSVVGKATSYVLDDQGVGVPSPGRVKNFLFSMLSKPALGFTQPFIQWVLGTLSPGVKRLGHEADRSSPASAKVKKIWIYTSTPRTSSCVVLN